MNLDEKVYNELVQLVSEHKNELFNKIAAERTDYINVVIENLYKEHNASAVLRTCDCYGIKKLHVIENENQYKVNRDIALGAGKWVDVETHVQGEPPSAECIKTLKNRGYKIIATTPIQKNSISTIYPSMNLWHFFSEQNSVACQMMYLNNVICA